MSKRYRQFTEENIKTANKYMKRYSISLTIRKMHMKTIMKYYLLHMYQNV